MSKQWKILIFEKVKIVTFRFKNDSDYRISFFNVNFKNHSIFKKLDSQEQCLHTIHMMLTMTDSTDYLTISGFTSLNGLICLHSVLDKAGSQSVFKRT